MRIHRILIGISAAAILACPATVWGNTAACFANGKALLAKADFQGALHAYATAARADRDNSEYLQRYSLVCQITTMRKRLGVEEKDPRRWEYLAQALHSFYPQGDLSQGPCLDRRIHARAENHFHGDMLAETELAMDLNE